MSEPENETQAALRSITERTERAEAFNDQLKRVREALTDAGYTLLHTYPAGTDFVESWMSRDSAIVLYRNGQTVKLFREIGCADWMASNAHIRNESTFTDLIAAIKKG